MRKALLILSLTLSSIASADSGSAPPPPPDGAPALSATTKAGDIDTDHTEVKPPAKTDAYVGDPKIPDPNTSPTDAVSTAAKLYHSGTIPAAIIVTAFFLLAWLSKHWAWLEGDHRAAIVAAVLGGLATIVEPLTRGTSPNLSMIGGAVVAGLALFANPKPGSTPPKV
jgi:hypothetical protein